MTETPLNSKYDRLVSAVQELSLARDLASVMKIVRTVAREITGADGATFILKEKDKCFYADEDAISPLWKGNRFPMENCISGWVMNNRTTVTIEDIYLDNRIPHAAYRPTFVKSLAVVPIRTIDPLGAIGNYWATHHTPKDEELNLLRSLADTTAVALENIQVYQDLEQRVKDRTMELEVVNNKLAESNSELEAIAYSLSHDLRSPLRHIKMNIGLLTDHLKASTDHDAQMFATKISKKVTAMQNLVTDLLTMFQVGKQNLQKSSVQQADIIKEIVEEFREAEPSRAIVLDMPSALPEAFVDKTLIRQVWINLISNAVKYTKLKRVAQIKIGFQQREDSAVFCIGDNGEGFDMSHYDKMFQPFQRLHSASQFEGAGVGLTIVDRIIKRHEGQLWATSEIGKGSIFYFAIPSER
jgi:K+-sensing histidine kinase KdpD